MVATFDVEDIEDSQIHQGREIIAIGALGNGAFCTVFSENFHKFYPQV
jgi:chromosome condensin MukBEF MukE localization factor